MPVVVMTMTRIQRERPSWKDGMGGLFNTKVIAAMFDLSRSHIIIMLVGMNTERRLTKKDSQLQERASTNSLGFTKVRGTDGNTTSSSSSSSDISPATSKMTQKTMLTECISNEVF